MKKLSGFSLMEMMIVLLIVSIVAAASAPMINKKLVGVATDKSPWVWVGNSDSIAYNLNGSQAQTASIGTTNVPAGAANARLFISSRGVVPQIALGHGNTTPFKIMGGGTSIMMTDNVDNFDSNKYQTAVGFQADATGNTATAIGYKTSAANNAVAVGYNASSGVEDIAIGHNAKSARSNERASGASIAIGKNSTAGEGDCIAIGHGSNSTEGSSIAIGTGVYTSKTGTRETRASGAGSIAIGDGPWATQQHSIAIGKGATSSTQNSLALGYLSEAAGNNAISIGYESYNNAKNTISLGRLANSRGEESISIGARSNASAWNATAVGERCIAGYGATAMGSEANAASSHSVALGYQARTGNSLSSAPSNDSGAVAIGPRANAKGQDAIAIGTNTLANFNNSVAIGFKAEAKAADQIVLGNPDSTVYIPGKLVVANDVFLATTAGRKVYARVPENTGRCDWLQILRHWDGGGWALKANSEPANYTVPGLGSIKSDRRLKNVGKAFIGGLNEIKKLEVFNYTFKSDKSKTPRVGVMAQDLQKIFPNAVVKGDDGFLRIRMEDMFYALINAVKEIDVRVTKLEKENLELKKQNQELMKRLTELEKKLK